MPVHFSIFTVKIIFGAFRRPFRAFVRLSSAGLKFGPWLRFWASACILSAFARFVTLWGFCCAACGLWLFPVSVLAVLAPLLWFPASSVDLWRLLAVVPRSVRMLCAVPVWILCRFQVCRRWLPCLASYMARYWLLFCFAGSSSPVAAFVVLWAFCGFGIWQRFRFWAWFPCMSSGGLWAWFVRRFFGFLLGSFAASSLVMVQKYPAPGVVPGCRSPRRVWF